MPTVSSFWAEHNDDMHDTAYALAFARESERIAARHRVPGSQPLPSLGP